MLFCESDESRRNLLLEHLKGRVVPVFAKYLADVRPLLMRNRVAAVVIRLEDGATVRPGWIERLRRDAIDPNFALVIHNAGTRPLIPGADEQLVHELEPEVLEVVVWDQMLELQRSGLHRRVALTGQAAEVASASRTEEEVQAEYTWSELLQAEANLTHLKLLMSRRVGGDAVAAKTDAGLARLLREDVSLDSLKRLMTYEIRLFGEA
jgi:hypothetical protein